MKTLPLLVSLVLVAVLVLATSALAGPPSWDDQINTPKRFVVLSAFGGEAVLDKETGLVWEKNPEAIQLYWKNACARCYEKTVGNRKGWRLPTVEELASLIDPTQSNPALPTGHPFTNVQNFFYWSSSTHPLDYSHKYGADLSDGVVKDSVSIPNYFWCVRGGQGGEPLNYAGQ